MAIAAGIGAAVPIILEMLRKESDAEQASGAQAGITQDQAAASALLREILSRPNDQLQAPGGPFRFGGNVAQSGGLSDEQFSQLTPQFARAGALEQLLGIGQSTSAIGQGILEQGQQDAQSQQAAAIITQIIAELGKNKGNVDPGSSGAGAGPVQSGGGVFTSGSTV